MFESSLTKLVHILSLSSGIATMGSICVDKKNNELRKIIDEDKYVVIKSTQRHKSNIH